MKIRLGIFSALVCLSIALPTIPVHSGQAAVLPAWATLNTSVFSSEYIRDVAVSRNYSQDKTIFVLTAAQTSIWRFNVWRTQDAANTWQKVFTSEDDEQLSYIALSPDYGKTEQVVYLLGDAYNTPILWRSSNAGTNWIFRPAPEGIGVQNRLLVASDTDLFLSGFNGIDQAFVYYSANGGFSYSPGAPVGNSQVFSMASSPGYNQDHTVLIGNDDGGVLWSSDNGGSFRLVSSSSLSGNIRVAFDARFASSRAIYAASENIDGGIYRTSVGVGQTWQRLDAALPSDERLGGLAVSSAGVLYAASTRPVNVAGRPGGLLRCLDPGSPASFERVNGGLSDGAVMLEGILECAGNQVWSVDSMNNRLITFVDSLSLAVNLSAPANNSTGIGSLSGGSVDGVLLGWQSSVGAANYEWQLSFTDGFIIIPNGFSGNTTATSAAAPSLSPAGTYFWRIRVIAPLYSPWSSVWSFSTASPPSDIGIPQLVGPLAGGSPLKPLFLWSPVAGVTGYELIVSAISDFTSPIISKTGSQSLSGSPWQSDVSLIYSTTYFWRVRGVTSAGAGPWSATGIFVTVGEPQIVPTATVTSTLPPPPPSLKTASASPTTPQPVVTTYPPTTTTSSPPVIQPIHEGTPDWVYFLLVVGSALLVLITIFIILTGNRKKR